LVEIGYDAEYNIKDQFDDIKKRHHTNTVPRCCAKAAEFLWLSIAHISYL